MIYVIHNIFIMQYNNCSHIDFLQEPTYVQYRLCINCRFTARMANTIWSKCQNKTKFHAFFSTFVIKYIYYIQSVRLLNNNNPYGYVCTSVQKLSVGMPAPCGWPLTSRSSKYMTFVSHWFNIIKFFKVGLIHVKTGVISSKKFTDLSNDVARFIQRTHKNRIIFAIDII